MLRKDLNECSGTFRGQPANFNQEEECLEEKNKKKCRQKSTTFYVHRSFFFVRLAVFEIINP